MSTNLEDNNCGDSKFCVNKIRGGRDTPEPSSVRLVKTDNISLSNAAKIIQFATHKYFLKHTKCLYSLWQANEKVCDWWLFIMVAAKNEYICLGVVQKYIYFM